MRNHIARLAAVMLAGTALAGCASMNNRSPSPNQDLSTQRSKGRMADGMPVTKAALPKEVEQYNEVKGAIQCIANTRELESWYVAVGQWIDDTGKKVVGPGGTSDMLPSAWSVLLESYSKMGATALDVTPVGRSIEDSIRSVLGQAPDVKTVIGGPNARLLIAGGTWRSLDLNQTLGVDMRTNGWGPTGNYSQAQLTMMTTLTQPGSRAVLATEGLERTVKYESLGVGVGAVQGSTLVTGNVAWSNQERLQFEALNGPVALSAAYNVVTAKYKPPSKLAGYYVFPEAHRACGEYIASIIGAESPVADLQGQPMVVSTRG